MTRHWVVVCEAPGRPGSGFRVYFDAEPTWGSAAEGRQLKVRMVASNHSDVGFIVPSIDAAKAKIREAYR